MLLTNAKLFLGALWILKKENKHSVSLKPISNNTSNSHPEHIINNAFIRIQRNKAQHESSEESERTKSRISGSDNDMERNKKIHWYILICWKAFLAYQTLLENIAYYLLETTHFSKATELGIEFTDLNEHQFTKKGTILDQQQL